MLPAYFLFASFLALVFPPWGISDEQQHFDYAFRISNDQSPPILGVTYLSEEVGVSVYNSDRWARYSWPERLSSDVTQWGLEGLSYEAHQPPLYYYTLATLLEPFQQQSIETQLSIARMLSVVFSTVAAAACWYILLVVRKRIDFIFLLSWAIVVLLPGRLSTVVHVSNDTAVEALGSLSFLALTLSLLERSRKLPLVFGSILAALAIATKISAIILIFPVAFVAWRNRTSTGLTTAITVFLVPFMGFFWAFLHSFEQSGSVGSDWQELSGMAGTSIRALVYATPEFMVNFVLFEPAMSKTYFSEPWALFLGAALPMFLFIAVLVGVFYTFFKMQSNLSTPMHLAAGTVILAILLVYTLAFVGLTALPMGRLLLAYTPALCLLLMNAICRFGPSWSAIALISFVLAWLFFLLKSPMLPNVFNFATLQL